MRTATENAYAAGVIDGEGCISCTKSCNLFVVVGMVSDEIVKWLHERYGGATGNHVNKSTRTGSYWRWQLNGTECKPFLQSIRPYVIMKREEISIALEICDNLRPRTDRSALTEREILIRLVLSERLRSLNSGYHAVRGKILKVQ